MSSHGFFVTGTDTGCGKTEITLGLMRLLQDQGYQVLGFKPVAAGAEQSGEGLRNDDALRIQDAGSLAVPYELVNPYCFEQPIAPHLAAAEAGRLIRRDAIRNCFEALTELADVVIVEGAGGWRVPLSDDLEVADLPALLRIPALLVVGLRLGCLNHTLLSADAILDKGCGFAGWIANRLDPKMLRPGDNLATLDERIPAPRLGAVERLPGRPDPVQVAAQLDAQAMERLVKG
jgi:dethiobiotin synthetase